MKAVNISRRVDGVYQLFQPLATMLMQPDAKFSGDVNKAMEQGCFMLFMRASCSIIHKL